MNNFPFSNTAQRFYLTGSRYFHANVPDSDWDYFTEDTPQVRQYLEEEGFILVPATSAHMSYTSSVTAVYYREGFHVQLVRCPIVKSLVQSRMRRIGLGPFLKDKALARILWQMLLP